MARVAFVLTTCHEFEGVKVLSSVLKLHGHAVDSFITSEERDYWQVVRDFEPDVIGIYATSGQEALPYPHIRRWKKELPPPMPEVIPRAVLPANRAPPESPELTEAEVCTSWCTAPSA